MATTQKQGLLTRQVGADTEIIYPVNRTKDIADNTFAQPATLATLLSGESVPTSMGKIQKAISELITHLGNVLNPHSVTKAQVGLGSVDNTADSAKNVLTATKWKDARKITVSGEGITATPQDIDGSKDITIPITISSSGSQAQIRAIPGTIPITGWAASGDADYPYKLAVTVNGIPADTTTLQVDPYPAGFAACKTWDAADVRPFSHAVNSITFYAGSVPSAAIPFYVEITVVTNS